MCTNHIMFVWKRKICICKRAFLWNQFWTREKKVMWSFFICSFHLSSAINRIHTLNAYAMFHSRITKCYTNNDSWRFTTLGKLGKYLCKCHTDWQTESQEVVFVKKIPLSLDASFFFGIFSWKTYNFYFSDVLIMRTDPEKSTKTGLQKQQVGWPKKLTMFLCRKF